MSAEGNCAWDKGPLYPPTPSLSVPVASRLLQATPHCGVLSLTEPQLYGLLLVAWLLCLSGFLGSLL